jgi:hypothetical protein
MIHWFSAWFISISRQIRSCACLVAGRHPARVEVHQALRCRQIDVLALLALGLHDAGPHFGQA